MRKPNLMNITICVQGDERAVGHLAAVLSGGRKSNESFWESLVFANRELIRGGRCRRFGLGFSEFKIFERSKSIRPSINKSPVVDGRHKTSLPKKFSFLERLPDYDHYKLEFIGRKSASVRWVGALGRCDTIAASSDIRAVHPP